MKRAAVITAAAVLSMGTTASAYIDLGNGQVQLEDGESYGSVAAAYGLNYYNLGYYNDCNPDEVISQPGDVISLGTASAQSYFYDANDGSDVAYTGNAQPVYSYNEWDYYYIPEAEASQYAGQPAYNEYSTEYSYWEDESYYAGYETQTSDAGITVDYGTADLYDDYYYAGTDTSTVYGSRDIGIGYYGNAATNVSRACELLNGVVIPAGSTFYASNYLGAGDASMGFLEAPGLASDGSTPMVYGSGICPVTTFVYQAGRDAGLDVVARSPHFADTNGDGQNDYYCSYAPDEADQASYSAGSMDLVMANNTGKDLVLNASYDLYGLHTSWSER